MYGKFLTFIEEEKEDGIGECRDEIPARKHVTNFGSNASCLISGGVKPTACIQNQDAIDVMNQDNTLNYKVCVGQKSKSG
jgi:hypothetical protein